MNDVGLKLLSHPHQAAYTTLHDALLGKPLMSRLEDDREVVARIMNQILMPHDPALAVRQLDLLDRLVNSVPFYVLRCTPTPAAFDAAFQMTLCDNGRERMHRCEGSGHED